MDYETFTKGMDGEVLAYAENLQTQRDEALERVGRYDADRTDLLTAHADTLAAKDAERATATADLEARHAQEIADLSTKLDETQRYVDALGGTEEAIRLANVARRQELERTKAQVEAELASLDEAVDEAREAEPVMTSKR